MTGPRTTKPKKEPRITKSGAIDKRCANGALTLEKNRTKRWTVLEEEKKKAKTRKEELKQELEDVDTSEEEASEEELEEEEVSEASEESSDDEPVLFIKSKAKPKPKPKPKPKQPKKDSISNSQVMDELISVRGKLAKLKAKSKVKRSPTKESVIPRPSAQFNPYASMHLAHKLLNI